MKCDYCGMLLGETHLIEIKSNTVAFCFCDEQCHKLFKLDEIKEIKAQRQVRQFLKAIQ